MLSCWRESPDDRPDFSDICQKFMQILESDAADYGYLSAFKPDAEIQMLSDNEVTI